MSRFSTIAVSGATFLALQFVSIGLAQQSATPNVVMIVGDDQHYGDFGFMGSSVVKTPRLDRLAAEGATFTRGYVPTSLCRASLASMLTGMYPHQHKICCNDPPPGTDRTLMNRFIKEAPAVPRLLKAAGYEAFQTGKFWEGAFENAGFTQGMTVKGRHGDDGLVIGRETMQPMYDFIAGCKGKPFFLWYAPMLPHEPHNPPARFLSKYESPDRHIKLAKYYAMCEWFDETCGQLLDHLEEKKLAANTLVVFVADNGWIQELGPNKTTRGTFAPKSKLSPYDGGLRTPIILRWSGKIPPGRHEDLVSSIDLAPTILAACNVKAPAEMPGLSLLDAAKNKTKLARDAVYGELFEHNSADIDVPAKSLTHRWVRQGDWKLIAATDPKSPVELYRVSDDPTEEKNVAALNVDKAVELHDLLDKWWKP